MSYFSIYSEPGMGREEFCVLVYLNYRVFFQGLRVNSGQTRVLLVNNSIMDRAAQTQEEKENMGILEMESL